LFPGLKLPTQPALHCLQRLLDLRQIRKLPRPMKQKQ
jgi:hypothetical protein